MLLKFGFRNGQKKMINLIQYLLGNDQKKCLDWRIKLTYLDLDPNFKFEGFQSSYFSNSWILKHIINAIRRLFWNHNDNVCQFAVNNGNVHIIFLAGSRIVVLFIYPHVYVGIIWSLWNPCIASARKTKNKKNHFIC